MGVFLSVLIGISYLIIFSSFFEIRSISIIGNDKLDKEELQRTVKETLDRKILFLNFQANILTLSKNNLYEIFRETFPQIDSINIEQKPLHSLAITISERKEAAIWCEARLNIINRKRDEQENVEIIGDLNLPEQEEQEDVAGCYYIDKSGVIFKRAPQVSGSLFLIIKDFSGSKLRLNESDENAADGYIQLGDKIANPQIIDIIVNLRNKITLNKEFRAKEFKIYKFNDLRILTSEGWEIYFDPAGDAQGQLDALLLALDKEISEEKRRNLEYIDLRVKGRVYYK